MSDFEKVLEEPGYWITFYKYKVYFIYKEATNNDVKISGPYIIEAEKTQGALDILWDAIAKVFIKDKFGFSGKYIIVDCLEESQFPNLDFSAVSPILKIQTEIDNIMNLKEFLIKYPDGPPKYRSIDDED